MLSGLDNRICIPLECQAKYFLSEPNSVAEKGPTFNIEAGRQCYWQLVILSILHLRHVADIMVTVTASEQDPIFCPRAQGKTFEVNGCSRRSKHWLYNNDHYIYNGGWPPAYLPFFLPLSVFLILLFFACKGMKRKKWTETHFTCLLCTFLKFNLARLKRKIPDNSQGQSRFNNQIKSLFTSLTAHRKVVRTLETYLQGGINRFSL